MYNPAGLDEERLSWRSVIYFNIARPVRRILDALDAFGEGDEDDDAASEFTFNNTPDVPSGTPTASDSADANSIAPSQSGLEKKVAQLRARLAPLLAAEASLTERLSDGVNVSGSGKGSVYVRSGWQSRTLGLAFGKARERTSSGGRFSFTQGRGSLDKHKGSEMELQARNAQAEEDKLIEDVAVILGESQADIRELWELPAVKKLRERRRLKLEEWAD